MSGKNSNIHPVFDKILKRDDKERMLNQHSVVVWFTGLSGSGKSTIAKVLEQELHKKGYISKVLDGDNVRTGINSNLGFSDSDRKENIRRIAEVSKLFMDCGIILINCFISPTNIIRNQVKEIVGKENYFEIFVNTSLETCEKRDTKGIYAKARKGLIKDFTGISAPYEVPDNPDIEIKTEELSINNAVEVILKKLLPRIEYKNV
ncbi:MAG: adenylyl-sulfate kinase [Bacteroidetes bacterium GWF2_33_16]|nr:MAG: adenylyl-sulfate kinase [Bacteroidetes bacterium GWE2_32_14]OFY05868.1 MAG: adenylyl-sulfate kinase [Bacteroidetes bacterium GWF2_33_16]